jgi:hypothetical protein
MAPAKPFTAQQIERFERGESFYFRRWDLEIDLKQTPIEKIFAPGYFRDVAAKLGAKFSRHDIVRVRSTDQTLDFDLTVAQLKGLDVTVRLRPRLNQAILDAAAAADGVIKPERTDPTSSPAQPQLFLDGRLPYDQEVA